MSQRIAKLKIKDGTVVIKEFVGEGTSNERETLHTVYESPHPDLHTAMGALVAHVRAILEWPSNYAENRISVTGVSWSKSEDTQVEGAVMTGLVSLESTDSPFSFNTPHMPFEQYADGNSAKLMPEDAQDALEAVRKEARLFLGGKRQQGDLFREAAE